MTTLHAVANWLYHFFGLKGTGPWYGFFSGFGSDVSELALLGGAWKMLNCHQQGCWRVGTRVTVEDNGHHFRRCHLHHSARHDAQADQLKDT